MRVFVCTAAKLGQQVLAAKISFSDDGPSYRCSLPFCLEIGALETLAKSTKRLVPTGHPNGLKHYGTCDFYHHSASR